MDLTSIYALVRAKIISVISSAMAEVIIPWINALLSGFLPSYFVQLIITFQQSGPLIASNMHMCSSHLYIHAACFIMTTVFSVNFKDETCVPNDEFLTDHVELLGGDGPKVAAYIRISKKGQSDFSIGGQIDEINSWKEKYKPSKIYWFFDKGKSSKSEKDFDKLKINDILRRKTTEGLTELWVAIFDRMGRTSRRLAHFYLDFSEDGGIIRTPEKVYGRNDLADFVKDAEEAERANRNRVKAVKMGTIRSFRLKHWNKRTPPIWYAPNGKWLQKKPEFIPWCEKMICIFHETEGLQVVCDRLGNFGGLLPKPLNTKQLTRYLVDPLHIGMPERYGFVVPDEETLAFYDAETRKKNLEILDRIKKKWKPKRRGPIEELALYKPITYLQTIEIWEWHHRDCGGLVRKTGTTKDEGIWQQLYSCKKCGDGWRLPHKTDNSNKTASKQEANNLGGLNFETNFSLANNHEIKKAKEVSSSACKKLIEPEPSIDGHNSTQRNLLGQAVSSLQKNCGHSRGKISSTMGLSSDEKRMQTDELSFKLSNELDKNKRLADFG